MQPESDDKLIKRLGALPKYQMPEDLKASIMAGITEKREPTAARRPAWNWAPTFAFAAAGLVAVVWVWDRAVAVPNEIPLESLIAAHEADPLLGDL